MRRPRHRWRRPPPGGPTHPARRQRRSARRSGRRCPSAPGPGSVSSATPSAPGERRVAVRVDRDLGCVLTRAGRARRGSAPGSGRRRPCGPGPGFGRTRPDDPPPTRPPGEHRVAIGVDRDLSVRRVLSRRRRGSPRRSGSRRTSARGPEPASSSPSNRSQANTASPSASTATRAVRSLSRRPRGSAQYSRHRQPSARVPRRNSRSREARPGENGIAVGIPPRPGDCERSARRRIGSAPRSGSRRPTARGPARGNSPRRSGTS